MKLSRIIEVALFIGTLLFLGVVVETKVSLAQNTCTNMRADQYRGQNGQQIACVCPANFGLGSVWGTDIYTDDSSICTAAVHAGLISFAAGGTVTIEIRAGQSSYMASSRNGVSTNNYGSWGGSYVFVTTQPPQQANRPPNAPTLLSPANTYQPPVGINPQQPYVQLSWQNNGDPDNDPVSFWLDTWYWDYNAQAWKVLFAGYVQVTSFTLTPPRLAYSTYYAWRVFAADAAQRSNPWYTASGWSYFLTSPNPSGTGDIIIDIEP